MNKEVVSFLISFLTASAIIGTGYLPDDHWLGNLGVAVHVWVWTMLVLGVLAAFIVDIDDLPKWKPWRAIPLIVMWILALAYVGWVYALGVYVVLTLVATIRRLDNAGKI